MTPNMERRPCVDTSGAEVAGGAKASLTRGTDNPAALAEAHYVGALLHLRGHWARDAVAAINYARHGWPVFPLQPGTKEPFKHSRGFHDATTDPKMIAAWWHHCPTANIGVATGHATDVLDLDRKPGKIDAVADTLPRLRRAGLLAGCIGIATTRNGGLHLHFPPSGEPCGALPRFGIDFKARGGYIVAPPSQVPSDYPNLPGAYTWDDLDINRAGRPLDWAKVKALLQPDRPRATTRPVGPPPSELPRYLADLLSDIQPADRSRAFHRIVCEAIENGYTIDATIELVTPWCEAVGKYAGRVELEVRRSAGKSGLRGAS